jgi:hypothetical protein
VVLLLAGAGTYLVVTGRVELPEAVRQLDWERLERLWK